MELKSISKIINLKDVAKQSRNELPIRHYSIRFDTDANVSILVDVPIEQICTVSETANWYVRFPNVREILMSRIADIAKAYEKMYESIGIGILYWEVRADDPE